MAMSTYPFYSKIIEHFNRVDPKIYEVIKTINLDDWFDQPHRIDYFTSLCRAVVGQQLAGKAAKAIFSRFLLLFENNKLTPENLKNLPDQTLRDVGMSWAKVASLKDLANKQLSKEIDLEKLDSLTDTEVIKELTKVKGIGSWTAEMFLMFTLQRPNVFSFGDLGLKNGLKKIYNIRSFSEKNINRIIKKWEPYKTFGAIALWHSLDNM